jgi:hypothetical protein
MNKNDLIGVFFMLLAAFLLGVGVSFMADGVHDLSKDSCFADTVTKVGVAK